MEQLEDDPADFMLSEVEGSSIEIRRRKNRWLFSSSTFSATLTLSGPVAVCSFIATIYPLTQSLATLIHLIMGAAIKCNSVSFGVSQANPSVSIGDFFQQQFNSEDTQVLYVDAARA
jgi:Cse1